MGHSTFDYSIWEKPETFKFDKSRHSRRIEQKRRHKLIDDFDEDDDWQNWDEWDD